MEIMHIRYNLVRTFDFTEEGSAWAPLFVLPTAKCQVIWLQSTMQLACHTLSLLKSYRPAALWESQSLKTRKYLCTLFSYHSGILSFMQQKNVQNSSKDQNTNERKCNINKNYRHVHKIC